MSYINTTTNQYPVSEYDIRSEHPSTSFPVPFVPPDNFSWVFPVPQPEHDPITQFVMETSPVLTGLGHYEQTWVVTDLEPEQITLNQEAKAATDAKLVQDKIEALWAAADKYTSSYISGVAIGILTIGVLQQKPKALAVSAWSSSVWTEYYVRKELVTLTSVDNHDFSAFGPIPHSAPELQVEVGL